MHTTAIAATTIRTRRARVVLAISLAGAALVGAACGGTTARDDSARPGVTTTAAASTMTPTTTTTTVTAADATAPSTPATASTSPSAPAAATADARQSGTRDELIGDEGRQVHVRCVGSGATTVLLIAGYESGGEGWSVIEPTIAESARVCSYDRPGTGTSDPATETQTFASEATDLHDLLTTIGEPGPYVVVGHSFGGAEAITFAAQYPDEVTGLVLVDATPVEWPAAICAVPDDGSDTATVLVGLCAGFMDPSRNSEHLDVFPAFADAAAIPSLGTLPMAVITAVDRHITGLPEPETTHLTEVWNDGQQQWSRLSSTTRLVSVSDTGHHIEIDQPAVVIDEITRLLP